MESCLATYAPIWLIDFWGPPTRAWVGVALSCACRCATNYSNPHICIHSNIKPTTSLYWQARIVPQWLKFNPWLTQLLTKTVAPSLTVVPSSWYHCTNDAYMHVVWLHQVGWHLKPATTTAAEPSTHHWQCVTPITTATSTTMAASNHAVSPKCCRLPSKWCTVLALAMRTITEMTAVCQQQFL